MIEVLQEGKGRKVELNYQEKLVYKSGSLPQLLVEWYKLKKAYNLKLNVPKPVKFIIQSFSRAQIVMLFIEGSTLENLLPSLDNIDKIKLAFSFGKVFKKLNKYKLWHKDIHKGNIIVTQEKEVFILDLYKLKKSLSLKASQVNQLSILYEVFIKELNLKIISSFLKGYLDSYEDARRFIKRYGSQIKERGLQNLINVLRHEISNLDNPRRFKKVQLEEWSGYFALRTDALLYESEILGWLKTYRENNKIYGEIIKEGRSALVVKYRELCLKFFKKRMHKWMGLKDPIVYKIGYTRARRSFLNSYLFYFISGCTPPPLAFFENKNGEGILVTQFIANSTTFSKFIEKLPEEYKSTYINKLLNWYENILNFNFISKDANLRNILIDSNDKLWLVDSLDIVYTNSHKNKIKSRHRLLKDLYHVAPR